MDIEEVVCASRSPWQNPYCERLVGSIRRECLDHVIVLNERHLRCILRSRFDYYLNSRTHSSLDRNAPIEREVAPPASAASSPFRKSADCTIGTVARPERPRSHGRRVEGCGHPVRTSHQPAQFRAQMRVASRHLPQFQRCT
ncbi:MAG: integrase core domain-containing protein [Planctomycetota bacterium]